MKRYLRWALKIAAAYLLFLAAYFGFALASMSNEKLAVYEQKLNPPTFVFWQGGKLFSNPPLFSDVMTDAKGLLASREPKGPRDVDIWVLLLDGPEDIRNVRIAPQLGVDVEKIANSKPGVIKSLMRAGLSYRPHPIPVVVERESVHILDARYLSKNFKEQCLDDVVYRLMINQHDKELWKRCKKS